MIIINEWLPNPVGNDASGEWIELFNNGPQAVALNGWRLQTENGKKFVFKNQTIGSGEYLVLARKQTKLVLKNTSESVFLYNNHNQLIDKSEFLGSAPEGKSFSRIISQNNAAPKFVFFVFSEATPGKENIFSQSLVLIENSYPLNQRLNPDFTTFDFLLVMILMAVGSAVGIIFLIKRNENLSKLFFNRD